MTPEQIQKLQEFKKLLDAGIITQQEFEAEKAKILNSTNYANSDTTQSSPDNTDVETVQPSTVVPPLMPSTDTSANSSAPVAENKSFFKKYWLAIAGGLVGLLIVIFVIATVSSRRGSPYDPDIHRAWVTLVNKSKHPFDVYVDGSYSCTVQGKSQERISVEQGHIRLKAEQKSGFVFKPTIHYEDLTAIGTQEYTWTFTD